MEFSPALFRHEIAKILDVTDQRFTLDLVDDGEAFPDRTSRWLLRQTEGESFFILLSPEKFPDVVSSAMNCARAVHTRLCERSAPAVVLPRIEGSLGVRSYAVFSRFYELPRGRIPDLLHRNLARSPVLKWLRLATEATISEASTPEQKAGFSRELGAMSSHDFPDSLRRLSEDGIARLDAAIWQPRFVMCHADLWPGNVLWNRAGGPSRLSRLGIIDWGAATPLGAGCFDLTRICISFRVAPATHAEEIKAHATLLKCRPEDMVFYLLSALGKLALKDDQFSRTRLIELSETCVASHLRALTLV